MQVTGLKALFILVIVLDLCQMTKGTTPSNVPNGKERVSSEP